MAIGLREYAAKTRLNFSGGASAHCFSLLEDHDRDCVPPHIRLIRRERIWHPAGRFSQAFLGGVQPTVCRVETQTVNRQSAEALAIAESRL